MEAIERVTQGGGTLTGAEWSELNRCEQVIERGLSVFYEVGAALWEIRQGRLYRQTHRTFEEYCREKWGLGRTYAFYLIEGAEVVESLRVHNCEHLPSSEAQTRALARLPDPQEQAQVWREWNELRQFAEQHGYKAETLQQMVEYREAVRQGRSGKQRTPPFPKEGTYNVILADPCWRYDFSNASHRAVENHYPTLELERIINLTDEEGTPVQTVFAPDCALYLWGTSPKLPDALVVLQAWGFTYKSSWVWHKSGLGQGYWGRIDHEFVLIGTRGQPGCPPGTELTSSVIYAQKTGHSRKPDEIRERIEREFPHARRLELFSRSDRPGWTHWGLEAPAPVDD